jgi:putative oxidoreductase
MSFLQSSVSLLGRGCIAAIFLLSGISKIFAWDQTLGFMEQHGMIQAPVFLFLAASVEVFMSICLFLGIKMRPAATILALYLIPVTYLFHGFWAISTPDLRLAEYYNFMKNLAIFGGLLCIASEQTCTTDAKNKSK